MSNNTETIICKCGATFEWETSPCAEKLATRFPKPTLCDSCENQNESDRLAAIHQTQVAASVERANQQLSKKIPKLYRLTNTHHERFNTSAWNLVKNWKSGDECLWLGLVGITGACKTRIACLIAEKELPRMASDTAAKSLSFEFVSTYSITDLAGKLSAPSFEEKATARKALNSIRTTDLLILDDMGKGKMSPAVASEMFALIDYRYKHATPMIWTANSMPTSFALDMPEDIAAPFAGRLYDSSHIVTLE